MSYCLKTNLVSIPDDIKQELISFAMSTVDVDFNFLKVNPNLSSRILNSIPDYFKINPDEMFLRLQMIYKTSVDAHFDKGRTSGIYIMLTDNRVLTHFYDWRDDTSRVVDNGWISQDQLDKKLSVEFLQDQVWLFDHTAIHSVDYSPTPRISLNLLYNNLPYETLVKLYNKNLSAY
jgi:hypothetical protein